MILSLLTQVHFIVIIVFKENKDNFNSSKDIKTNALGDAGTYLDSAFAYSWKVEVRPYEIAHRRVAYTVRPTSYYVSSSGIDSTSRDGSYSEPFATIDYAMSKLNGKRGYIYIMDYDPIDGSIDVPVGSGTDITILSSNFDENGVKQSQTMWNWSVEPAPPVPCFVLVPITVY